MISILIIGMGKFGQHLGQNLVDLGHEGRIVDTNQAVMDDLIPFVTSAKIGDCTSPDVLKSLGVGNFDICFVCIGTNFQSSLEITSQLKEMGAKYVVSKANRDIHAKFLLRNGADEVIYPDRDIAEKAAMKFSANHVFDYIELTPEYSIFEIPTIQAWHGKTILEVNCRAKYHINIIGVKAQGRTSLLPGPDYVFDKDVHLLVLGHNKDVDRLLKKIRD